MYWTFKECNGRHAINDSLHLPIQSTITFIAFVVIFKLKILIFCFVERNLILSIQKVLCFFEQSSSLDAFSNGSSWLRATCKSGSKGFCTFENVYIHTKMDSVTVYTWSHPKNESLSSHNPHIEIQTTQTTANTINMEISSIFNNTQWVLNHIYSSIYVCISIVVLLCIYFTMVFFHSIIKCVDLHPTLISIYISFSL